MNLILFSQREGRARQLNLAHPVTLGVVGVLALGILGTAFALGMKLGQRSGAAMHPSDSAQWAQVLTDQRKQIADLRSQLQERVEALEPRERSARCAAAVPRQLVRRSPVGRELAGVDPGEHARTAEADR